MYYLAYGSNMAEARLRQRVPSAQRIGTVSLPGHRLTFENGSTKDGSGKCDAFITGNPADRVLAVLYLLDPAAKAVLDVYEGVGVEYRAAFVEIVAPAGETAMALIYYATNLNPALKPFHWYKEHVIRGAEENDFPADYVASIAAVAASEDPDFQRSQRELAIYR